MVSGIEVQKEIELINFYEEEYSKKIIEDVQKICRPKIKSDIKIIITSTPKGNNVFYKMFKEIKKENYKKCIRT